MLGFKKWLTEVGDAVWTTPEKQKPAMYATAMGNYTAGKKTGEEDVPAAMKKKMKKKQKR